MHCLTFATTGLGGEQYKTAAEKDPRVFIVSTFDNQHRRTPGPRNPRTAQTFARESSHSLPLTDILDYPTHLDKKKKPIFLRTHGTQVHS